ncbi:DUF2274 domain-containing protein [Sphingopyxis sp. JAI128]|uniref:DUF2274 domain-containing protein n=1 Tax=Sphingopyxis sp. JAI128 TaxID=2723066 RepID=UPI00161D89CB|nr:DUF2274 domain-containing protein [Sphingopyxis sp. JAI128]MBB6427920.1 hypothetical protein [Sphingopyxis sp. JAI128]
MTKLRLGPVAEEKPVKLTLELPGWLMREIMDYARVHARLNALGAPLPPERILPAMIDRFIAGDREFSKQRRRAQ